MEIFTQLGVDSSLPYQFAVLAVAFILANFLFLGKLQNVLDVREEKTVKMENSADETLEKVTTMQSEYKAKIEDANRTALKTATEKKHVISQKLSAQFKQTEKELNTMVDTSRADFKKEVASNKDKYLAESEVLAQSLVNKILQ